MQSLQTYSFSQTNLSKADVHPQLTFGQLWAHSWFYPSIRMQLGRVQLIIFKPFLNDSYLHDDLSEELFSTLESLLKQYLWVVQLVVLLYNMTHHQDTQTDNLLRDYKLIQFNTLHYTTLQLLQMCNNSPSAVIILLPVTFHWLNCLPRTCPPCTGDRQHTQY